MAVTYIRPHRRFAVRQTVRIAQDAGKSAEGLLIELSIRGCRISNLARTPFVAGERVALEIDGFAPICGSVRWAHDGFMGLYFDAPLYTGTFDRLVCQCRGEQQGPAQTVRSAQA